MEPCTSTNIYHERFTGSPIPTEQSVRLCAEAGYRLLDMCFVDLVFDRTAFITDRWRAQLQGFQQLAESLSLRFIQSHSPLDDFLAHPDAQTWRYVQRSVEASAMLGVGWMAAHPATLVKNGAVSPETQRGNVEYFRRLSDYAGRFQVGIALENMWGVTREGVKRYAIDPHELCELCDRIDAQNVGICWDTEHAAIEGIGQRESLRLIGKRLKALHISDLTGAENVHILPYTGHIEWNEVLCGLREIAFSGPFTFELQHYLRAMPEAAVPAALRLSYLVGLEMARGDPRNQVVIPREL